MSYYNPYPDISLIKATKEEFISIYLSFNKNYLSPLLLNQFYKIPLLRYDSTTRRYHHLHIKFIYSEPKILTRNEIQTFLELNSILNINFKDYINNIQKEIYEN